jgi:hypothetical protein
LASALPDRIDHAETEGPVKKSNRKRASLPQSKWYLGRYYDWQIELDIRAIKITMGMDVLRCKWPEMVRREIWTCLLAYNLIRQAMLEAALHSGRSPRVLSFTAALQKIAAAWAILSVCDPALLEHMVDVHLEDIANNLIGNRPDRIEPRQVKRRPKPHRLLTEPRDEARAKLLQGTGV